MTEAQIQLQNALTTTFLANLAFLSEYDNELYHRVDELSRMIENGSYKEKYALEFIMECGDFDIYDIVNDKYLYNKNPKKMNNDLIRKVQFDEKSSILDVSDVFLFKNKQEINKSERFNFEHLNQLSRLTLNDAWEYSNILQDFLENQKKYPKKIKKFLFLGTLLGRHIPIIAQNIDAEMYLVLEKNLEIFRLSLFVVDYTVLAKKGVVFSIMDSSINTEQRIAKFFNIRNLENYFIKFSTTNINIEDYVDKVLNVLHTLNPISYDYNRKLYSYVNRTTKYLENGLKTLLINNIKDKCNFFDDLPVLYLAAGPSLDENIEWIKENQNNFYIVTIGAAYKKLINNNIRIDMITTLDEQYNILNDKQFDDESVSKIGDNTIILASSFTNEKILKKFNQDNLFLYEVFKSFHAESRAFDGFSIGEVTLDILLHLNIKRLYLIGLDLSLNQKTGDSHSQNSNSGTIRLNLDVVQNRDTFNIRTSLIKVKGNLNDIVYTTPLFFTSIKSAESKIFRKNKDVEIFNLSENGAYFEGTIPTKLNDIKEEFRGSVKENKNLMIFLNKYSTSRLSSKSKKIITDEIKIIKNDLINLLDEIANKNYKNFDELFKEIYRIATFSLEKELLLIYQIVVNYFEIVVPYLFYHFNDKYVRNEKKKINEIKKVFEKQMNNIIDDYLFCISRITKN